MTTKAQRKAIYSKNKTVKNSNIAVYISKEKEYKEIRKLAVELDQIWGRCFDNKHFIVDNELTENKLKFCIYRFQNLISKAEKLSWNQDIPLLDYLSEVIKVRYEVVEKLLENIQNNNTTHSLNALRKNVINSDKQFKSMLKGGLRWP